MSGGELWTFRGDLSKLSGAHRVHRSVRPRAPPYTHTYPGGWVAAWECSQERGASLGHTGATRVADKKTV